VGISLALCGFCLEKRRILGAVDDDWLGRRQLEDAVAAERPGRLVAGVKLVAGA
jgi:hypothetical protein